MELSDKKGVQQIVQSLAALGLKEIVICPGSRNASFVISFNRHPAFNCTSIRDERTAGFYALGKAIELQEPVAILCTSGSAALNFAPAIVEAYYQRIPLIVLTTDRPKEWTNQGDGQTILQTNIYTNYIRKSYEINGDAVQKNDLWYIERCISEGFNIATLIDKGPVHFNIPVSEPLYGTSSIDTNNLPKIFKAIPLEKQLSKTYLEQLANQFSSSKKVLILVGQLYPNQKLQYLLSKIAQLENVIILTESTSNLHHPDFVENIDRCITGLTAEDTQKLMPDLLISIGDAIVSKRIKKLLRDYAPTFHWNIDEFDSMMDTYQSLTDAIALQPTIFLQQLLEQIKPIASTYKSTWIALKNQKEQLHQAFCKQIPYSDFSVFNAIYKTITPTISVHIANSSAIRYAQLFDNSKIKCTWSNRGTSGIDGSSSTVVGSAASAPDKDFLLISGDISFHYDKNAFWIDEQIDNLKVIIINNSGGGIFRIIPGPDKIAEREQFIETSMHTNAEKLAEHYQWNYLSVKEENTLESTLIQFFNKTTKRTILEIFTDAEQNPIILEQYWKLLKDIK